ncbi:MAG: hypothetical protein IJ776_09340 [Paludibacteraceae bacterium]|nr:hypothetical protein [Paludibacteraceae bacterium]
MKAETAIKNLEKVADSEMRVNKRQYRGTKAWRLIMAALENNLRVIRPCEVQGTGRYIKNADYTAQVRYLLVRAKIKFSFENDAPRGGV